MAGRSARVWLGPVLWLAMSAGVAAQVGGGALIGAVSDQAGAAVPGATVTATAVATTLSRVAVTGSDGTYSFPRLASGS